MRFLMSADLRHHLYLKVLLLLFSLAVFFFLTLNIELEYFRLGLSAQQILTQLLGKPEAFLPAKDAATLLTEIHVNLFLYPMIIMSIVSVLVHAPLSEKAKLLWIVIPSSAVLAEIFGIILTRFVSPHFVYLKILGFWTFEISMLLMVFRVVIYLFGKPTGPRAGNHFHG